MGKGGPLSAWIREFTTLVFVQTVQAFIFAIIITLIMTAMNPPTDPLENDDYNVGVGLMCVFALTSLFKVEEIVKKIFGLQSTKADHSNAIKSIAKTAFAIKLGKRALDNGKKIVGGGKQIYDSHKGRLKNKQRYKEDLNDLGIKKPEVGKGDKPTLLGDNPQDTTKPNNNPSANPSGGAQTPLPVGVDASTDSSKGSSKKEGEVDYVDNVLNSNTLNPKTQQKLRALKRQYEDKDKDLKKQRRQGIESIAKGLVESGGVILGAPMGAVLGGADGNLDEALQGMVAGAGIGDAMGEIAFNTANVGEKILQSAGGSVKDFGKEIQAAKQQIEKDLQDQGKELSSIDVELDAIKTTVRTKHQQFKANRDLAKKSISDIEKDFLSSNKTAYGNSVDDV